MSPEQAAGKELDGRTDLFSFGAVFYEMAISSLPFRGESSALIFNAILERVPIPPLRLNPELPIQVQDIITKALEKDRNLRYQSAVEMCADLQRLKRQREHGMSHLASMPERKGRRLLWSWGIVAAVVLIAGSLFIFNIGGLREKFTAAAFVSMAHSRAVSSLIQGRTPPLTTLT
jgi:serine/threonine protein kinase